MVIGDPHKKGFSSILWILIPLIRLLVYLHMIADEIVFKLIDGGDN